MHPESNALLVRRRSLQDILDEGVRFTRRNALRMVPAVAIPMAVAAIAMAVAQMRIMGPSLNPTAAPDLGELGVSMALMFSGVLVYMVVSIIGNTALLGAVVWQVEGRPRSMGRAWLWAFNPKVFGTALMVGMVVLLGTIMCLVPGIILGLLYGLTMVAVASEKVYGTTAMARSWNLATYNPEGRAATHPAVKLFVIGVVGYLLAYLTSMAVQLPFMIGQQAIIIRSIADASHLGSAAGMPTTVWWLQVPQSLLGAVTSELVALYMACAAVLLFRDLQGIKEGEDLDHAMDEFGAPPAGEALEHP